MTKYIWLFSISILIFFLGLPQFNSVSASHKIFQENFDSNSEGSFPNGWILVNDPDTIPCNATWKVVNGMAGVAIVNQGSCSTNIMPNDTLWNNLGDNYIFEADMKFVTGTNHNIAFRFTPSTPTNNWYDLSWQTTGDFILERVTGNYTVFVPKIYPNGNTYHLKIVVNHEHIQVYINNELVRDFTSTLDNFPTGRIALRASTGADPNSETYFDNVVVTSIDDTLSVPYFSQNDLPWGPTEYDHAQSLGISSPTMDRWSCKVTSTAMILNYHGMTQFADGTPINPGTLNDWLNNHNGYLTGTDSDGPYSYLDMSKIPQLTKDLFTASKSAVKLEYEYILDINASSTATLNDDLLVKKTPDILQVENASTSSHFVVATGLNDGIYNINDPEWNVPNLSSFNNSYKRIDRLIPTHTNLSFITIASNPSVDLLVTDSLGRKTGEHIESDSSETSFNDIPNASYSFEAPISNPDSSGVQQQLGTGVNVFMLPKPGDGKYHIETSSKTAQQYTINISTITASGSGSLAKTASTVSPGQDETFDLNFSQDATASSQRIVTFDSTIQDIKEAQSLGLINPILAKTLIVTLKNAEKQANSGHKKLALLELLTARILLDEGKKHNLVDANEYETLTYDLNYLKTHL